MQCHPTLYYLSMVRDRRIGLERAAGSRHSRESGRAPGQISDADDDPDSQEVDVDDDPDSPEPPAVEVAITEFKTPKVNVLGHKNSDIKTVSEAHSPHGY